MVMTLDRAGLVAEDGETHQGLYDIAWARTLPGVILLAPKMAASLLICCIGPMSSASTMIDQRYLLFAIEEVIPPYTWGQKRHWPQWAKLRRYVRVVD